jgi:hypothetical protein
MTYFIQFNDLKLESINVHAYEEGSESSIKTMQLNDIHDSINLGSDIYVMLPSAALGYKKFENYHGLKKDVLRANIFSESEDQLISDISTLKFFYHPELNLASWIDSHLFNRISDQLNELDGEIYIFPEHFLLHDQANILYITHDSFICSFSNFTGFSGSHKFLSSYLEILQADNFDLQSFKILKEDDSITLKEFDQSGSQVTKFKALHLNFLETNRFKNSNYFKRSFSLKYLKFKFKISSLESWAISASLLLLLVVPFLISSTINSSAKDYQGKTIQIFQQLNPNFNRLVNARAQIDDLTRDIPRQNSFSNQDLGMLQYLEQLNDSSVKKIKIDLQAGSIAISLEGLPTYKLELLQQLFQSEPLTFEVSGLVEKDKAMFGKLLVSYES